MTANDFDIPKLITMCLEDMRSELIAEFSQNFIREGFFTQAWKRRKYQAEESRGVLTKTGNLRKAIRAEIEGNKIVFINEMPYANIHNEGGKIRVTKQMKGYFWYQYKQATQSLSRKQLADGLTEEAAFYKAMALKRVGSYITMPRRQFIGMSAEVEAIIREIVESNLETYFNDKSFKVKIK